MNRWIVRAIGVLLFGFIVSLIIAVSIWLSAGRPAPDPLDDSEIISTVSATDLAIWGRCRSVGWPARPDWAWDEFGFGRCCRTLHTVTGGFNIAEVTDEEWDRRMRQRSEYTVDVAEAGWPVRCLALEFWWESHYPTPFTEQTSGLQLGRILLPNRLLWRGVLLDTLFYSVVVGLFLFGALEGRGRLRRARGRCIKCGYDLRGDLDTGCPECGWNREKETAS